jgi:hypothetical protein
MTHGSQDTSSDAQVDFLALLNRFEDAVRATGAGVAGLLAPGISEAQVRAELAVIGMEPAQELVTWFGWHNGLTTAHPETTGDGCLLRWCPLSLRESIDEWQRMPRGPELWQWKPTWLPIGLFGGPQRLAVDCTPPQARLATVREAVPEFGYFDESQVPSVTGFATVVGWWLEALEQGWYTFVPEANAWDWPRRMEMPMDRILTDLV